MEGKFKVIGERRKNQARQRIGGFLYEMYKEKKQFVVGKKTVCLALKMNVQTFNKHFGGFFDPMDSGKKEYFRLDSDDMDVISQTVAAYEKLLVAGPKAQRIAQLVFLHLAKNGK